MKRPPARARIQWHTWMPWYEFSCLIGEAQDINDRADNLLPLAGGGIIMTLTAALLFPAFLVPCSIAGGLLTVSMLTYASRDGRRLVAGVRAAGLSSPRVLLRIGARLAADDVKLLWSGRASNGPILEGRLLEPPEPRMRALVVAHDPEGGEDDIRTRAGERVAHAH